MGTTWREGRYGNLRRLIERAANPAASVVGQRADLLLEVMREWAEPITTRELRELLGWPEWMLTAPLTRLEAEGLAGHTGRGLRSRWIADPPLTDTLTTRPRSTR